MKNFLALRLTAFFIAVLFFACQKEPVLTAVTSLPAISINKITELPFSNTEWQHVFGGMAEIRYIKEALVITDSLNLSKLPAYQKTLELGTYDVQLRTKSIAAADTFIRFSAELKGLVVDKGQAISLTGNTNDGLITISKDFVKENTVPTFIPAEPGSKSYRMGLIKGFYYIYVAAGKTGQVSFHSKATDDQIVKNMTIAATNHYNLVVVTNGSSSIGVVFQTFAYQEVPVSSSTLITIETPPSWGDGYEKTFIIADETGKILNSVKYQEGTSILKLAAKEPYTKDRLSVFLLSRSLDAGTLPGIWAQMNVKRGSVWSFKNKELSSRPNNFLKVSLKSVPLFSNMSFSTDQLGFSIKSASDIPVRFQQQYWSSDVSKIFFQVENEGKAHYNFFDLNKGSQSFEIDPELCTLPSLSKSISLPGPAQMWVYANKDKNYAERYCLGEKSSQWSPFSYFYPDEKFEEYYTVFSYVINGTAYTDTYNGTDIPETSSPLNVSVNVQGNTLGTFQPTLSGEFDYYQAHFINPSLVIDVFTPAAATATKLVYPDFSSFTGFSVFNTSTLILDTFEAFKYAGFSEDRFSYNNFHSASLNGKAMLKRFL
jgi:hypothetical protein